MSSTEPLSPVKRKRGRPRKEEILAKKARGVVGRPPGEAAVHRCKLNLLLRNN